MKKLYYVLSFILLFTIGCGKENDNSEISNSEPEQLQIIEGGKVSRFKITNLEMKGLTQENYKGNINGKEINLVRSDENTLLFLVDQSFDLGDQFLEIPELKSKVKYNVTETVLEKTVGKTLEELSGIFNTYVKKTNNTKTGIYVRKSIESYNEAVSKLSNKDKKIVASVYQANKDFFNSLYQKDYTIPQAKSTSADYSHLSFGALTVNWAGATFGAGSATWLAVASASMPLVALPLAVVAVTLWSVSYDLWKEGVSRTEVIYDQFEWDGSLSNLLNKSAVYNKSSNLEFINGIEKTIPFKLKVRGITSKDKNSENTTIKLFFKTITSFNKVVNNLNSVITKVNSLPLVNISLISEVSVGTSKSQTLTASEKVFNNLKISVAHENLELRNVKFSNGKIYMTINIKNETKVDKFIESTINYSYKDETNEFKNSFPIKVIIEKTKEEKILDLLLAQTWHMGSEAKAGINTFSCTSKYYNYASNSWVTQTAICGGMDYIVFKKDYTFSFGRYSRVKGTFSVNGNSITLTAKNETSSILEKISFTGTKVKVNGKEYFSGQYNSYYKEDPSNPKGSTTTINNASAFLVYY